MYDARQAAVKSPELSKYLLAAAGVAVTTAILRGCPPLASIPNVSMLYLIVVTAAALRLGRLPAILCAVLSFLAFDYYFVKPVFSIGVTEPSEWVALCMFLFASLVISQLTAALKAQAEEAQRSRKETQALAEASWSVATELDRNKALQNVLKQLIRVLPVEGAAIITRREPDKADAAAARACLISIEQAIPEGGEDILKDVSEEAVDMVLNTGKSVGLTDSALWDKALAMRTKPEAVYLPASLENEVLGVIYIKLRPEDRSNQISGLPAHQKVLQSLANNAAVVLHRDKVMHLQAKTEALSEADRLKTALLSMVSHDFRSPLTSIKANVGNLLAADETVIDEETKQILESIEAETDRLNKLVGNILDLSRLETDAWKPKKEISEITDIIGPALDALSQSDNQRIDIKLDPGLHEVLVDSVQITQVLRNLLENALKYSAPDSRIEVVAHEKGEHFELSIKDRGIGLPYGEEAMIFQPFYRAPSLRETSLPGMGVGLAVCKGLVESNGGTIKAINRDGGGCIFSFTIPTAGVP